MNDEREIFEIENEIAQNLKFILGKKYIITTQAKRRK